MAGSVTTYKKNTIWDGQKQVDEHIWAWTADDTDGSIASKASSDIITGEIKKGASAPGAVEPTDLYDITLTDVGGEDVFGGELADRSATQKESVTPLVGNAYNEVFVNSVLTFNGSNNAVNSANGVFTIYVRKS